MIVSRCFSLGRPSNKVVRSLLLKNLKSKTVEQTKRLSHSQKYYYRQAPTEPPINEKLFEIMGAIGWWWVLWHLFTDYHELLPHHLPDPSKWTDEELGVPPLHD